MVDIDAYTQAGWHRDETAAIAVDFRRVGLDYIGLVGNSHLHQPFLAHGKDPDTITVVEWHRWTIGIPTVIGLILLPVLRPLHLEDRCEVRLLTCRLRSGDDHWRTHAAMAGQQRGRLVNTRL